MKTKKNVRNEICFKYHIFLNQRFIMGIYKYIQFDVLSIRICNTDLQKKITNVQSVSTHMNIVLPIDMFIDWDYAVSGHTYAL